jgi:hypothetical protein
MDEVVDATVHLRRHFHGRPMCCRELVREHLFEAVPGPEPFRGDIDFTSLPYQRLTTS